MEEKKNKRRQRRSFSREFKIEALRVLDRGEKGPAQLAMELGIRRNMLFRWREELKGQGERAFAGGGRPAKGQESEVARLRAELKRVTEERDILKKAAAYFAKARR
jgi:transposase